MPAYKEFTLRLSRRGLRSAGSPASPVWSDLITRVQEGLTLCVCYLCIGFPEELTVHSGCLGEQLLDIEHFVACLVEMHDGWV